MLVRARELSVTFRRGAQEVSALRRAEFDIEPGEHVVITGTSGSGKSTLLHLLGCLCRPTAGRYELNGVDVTSLSDRELSRVRSGQIGFVFQTFHLMGDSSVLENVEMPFLYRRARAKEARSLSRAALERVGLEHRLTHRPGELSGGEMQRVAIARALAVRPSMLLADEPTGNLDDRTGDGILELFRSLNDEGTAIVMVTHDSQIAASAPRRLHLTDGVLEELGAPA